MAMKYTFVAKGGFGFVIKPNIITTPLTNCEYNETKNSSNIWHFNSYKPQTKYNLNTVSKIFMDKEDAIDEFENHLIIDSIDPEYKVHLKMLPQYENCPLRVNKISFAELKKIYLPDMDDLINQYNNNYYYINYEFGGLNLTELFEDKYKSYYNKSYYNKDIYIHLCREIYKLMEVVKLLLEKQYIHHDLKHNNIMVSHDLSLKMIDFGLMEYIPEYTEFCKDEDNNNPIALFEFFPFETEYYNVKNYNNHKSVAEQKRYIPKYEYLETNYQYFFARFVKGEYEEQYNQMIATMDTVSHDDFLHTSFNTFDIYTLGITLIFLTEQYVIATVKDTSCSDFYSRFEHKFEYPEWLQFDKLRPLIVKMITPNVFNRIHIDELLAEFEIYIHTLNTIPTTFAI